MSGRTVVDEDLDLVIATDSDGDVILSGDWPPTGEGWHFTPDEARRLAGTLLRHSGQGGGFSALFEDDDVYRYGPSRTPWPLHDAD